MKFESDLLKAVSVEVKERVFEYIKYAMLQHDLDNPSDERPIIDDVDVYEPEPNVTRWKKNESYWLATSQNIAVTVKKYKVFHPRDSFDKDSILEARGNSIQWASGEIPVEFPAEEPHLLELLEVVIIQ
jgi:hypothetical protein